MATKLHCYRIVIDYEMPQTKKIDIISLHLFLPCHLMFDAWKLYLYKLQFPFAAKDILLLLLLLFRWCIWKFVSVDCSSQCWYCISIWSQRCVVFVVCRDSWVVCNWRYDYYYDLSIKRFFSAALAHRDHSHHDIADSDDDDNCFSYTCIASHVSFSTETTWISDEMISNLCQCDDSFFVSFSQTLSSFVSANHHYRNAKLLWSFGDANSRQSEAIERIEMKK